MASASTILRQTAAIRVGYGLGSWFAPQTMVRAFGLPEMEEDTRYLNAAFGGRDFSVAGVTEAALRAGRQREAFWLNASCEATDLVALLLEVRRRGGIDRTLAVGIVFNGLGWLSVARTWRTLKS